MVLACVEPGQGATVDCGTRRVDGDVRLEATIELTDAVRAPAWLSDGSLLRGRSRLIGFEWSSDNGWTGVLDPPEPTEPRERLRMIDTLLNWDVWQPSRIAAVIDRTRRQYGYDTTTDTLADLERRAHELRAALEELCGDAPRHRRPDQRRAREPAGPKPREGR